jgi:hypothetical protein
MNLEVIVSFFVCFCAAFGYSASDLQLARSRARGIKDALAAAEAQAGAALVVGQPNEGVANEGGDLADEAIAQKLMFDAEPVEPAAS